MGTRLRNWSLACLALLVVAAPAGASEELSFNYVQFAFVDATVEAGTTDVDGDGFDFLGSVEIAENYFIVAGYTDLGFDMGVDFSTLQAGVGYNRSLSDAASFYATLSYLEAEIETPIGDFDDDGLGISAGVRGLVANNKVELFGAINYVDFEDSDESLTLGALYNFTPNVSAGLQAEFGDDSDSIGAGVRFYWGR